MAGTIWKTVGELLVFPFSIFFFVLGILNIIPTPNAGLAGIYAPVGIVFVAFSILLASLGIWLIKKSKSRKR